MVGSHKLNNTSSRLCKQPTVALALLSAGILSLALLFHAQTHHHHLARSEKTGEDEAGGSLQAAMSRWDLFPPPQKGFHMVQELPRGVLRLWCVLPKKLADGAPTCRHHRRKMITAVVTDWQLFAVPSTRPASPWLQETLTTKGETKRRLLIKEKWFVFLLPLYHLRQVRRLPIPNGTSTHAYRLGRAPCFEREIGLFGESVRWKFLVHKNVLKCLGWVQKRKWCFFFFFSP